MTDTPQQPPSKKRTPLRPIRVDDDIWEPYKAICARDSTDATNDLLGHIGRRILESGTPEEIERYKRGVAAQEERRSRVIGARKKKSDD
ncbi:hypothetical protein HNR23_002302 [Nocardiopsis mwathae]|uniref:Uncharacterized protein n=1 Tax=Nocardiopsis mwathae TaxID=1472723 RepID=A0A7W9YHI5_9ACTN|nr:hypothetical protein [Nocardiopsis mwathae]MBB6172242.1 hypothetical protein [Nocardiopsis mwathae]